MPQRRQGALSHSGLKCWWPSWGRCPLQEGDASRYL